MMDMEDNTVSIIGNYERECNGELVGIGFHSWMQTIILDLYE